MATQIWDLWFPGAAAQGLPFARGRLQATETLWVHAAPDELNADVRTDDQRLIAAGEHLRRTGDFPMAKLTIRDREIERVDGWPSASDIGLPVMLPGGEVGILRTWWNALDGSEWRWQVEFYNHR